MQEEEEEQELKQQAFRCPHCGSRSETIFDKEASKMTFLFSFIALILFGFYSLLIIPLIIQATRTIVKKCYDCNEAIESHDLFSIPSFNDEVLNFRFGSCALVLSRKYAYVIIAFFSILYVISSIYSDPVPEQGLMQQNLYTPNSWEQYVEECGKDKFISNGVAAHKNYLKHYDEKIVDWEGVFITLKPPQHMLDSKYGIYIKMQPTDSIEGVQDIILIIDKQDFRQYEDGLKKLQEGDVVKFEAKFLKMGDEFNYHALEVVTLNTTTGKNIPLDSIITITEHKMRNNN